MTDFLYLIKPVFFWLFILSVVVTLVVNVARVFLKDEAAKKKREYLFYCCLFINAVLVFILGVYGVNMPDHEVWKLVVEIGGGMVVILGLFVIHYYQDLWLQLTPAVSKRKKR